MPWDRPASLATSPSVVLPSPFFEMHLIVASINCEFDHKPQYVAPAPEKKEGEAGAEGGDDKTGAATGK